MSTCANEPKQETPIECGPVTNVICSQNRYCSSEGYCVSEKDKVAPVGNPNNLFRMCNTTKDKGCFAQYVQYNQVKENEVSKVFNTTVGLAKIL